MRIGVVSDIHCNATGLRAALAAMGAIDQLICAGDSIHEYRFSNEVVAILRDCAAHTILGNHEEGFYGPHGMRARDQEWIDPDHLDWLATRPHQIELELAGRRIVIVHSTPWSPRGQYVYPHSPELARFGDPSAGGIEADYLIYGHTHAPVTRRIGSTLVVNPGSAGQARDGNGLSCAVLELESGEASIVEYSQDTLIQTKVPA